MKIIGQERQRTKEKILDAFLLPLRRLLPTALLELWCLELNHTWRERTWGPVVTVLACVWKHMQTSAVSARTVEDGVAELGLADAPVGSRSGSDFCHARQRLPLGVLQRAVEHVGGLAAQSCGRVFRRLRVVLVDGSSVRTANSKTLDARYGRSSNKTSRSKHPIVRMLAVVCAGSSAVLNVLTDAYRVSEQALFIRLLESLKSGALIVADRAYGSYLFCCLVTGQGSHLLARLRADRQGTKVKRLGHRDKLIELKRPKPSYSARPDLLKTCPKRLHLRVIERTIRRRGYRTWTLILVTTLLDPVAYPASELVDIYLRRWHIETVFRTLKTDYGMARVWGQTPDVIEKEIRSTILAYNCVAALAGESGEAPEIISATRARDIVMRHTLYMAHAATIKLPGMYSRMLRLLATALQLPQERPPQPRVVLKNKSDFPVLKGSREEWRKKHAA